MKKLWFLSLALLILCTACHSAKTEPEKHAGVQSPGELSSKQEIELQMELLAFMKLLEFTREHYVDADKVSYKKLFQNAMKGLLNELDPYSNYETPEGFSRMMEDTRGSFAGIGATIRKVDDGIELIKIQRGSPAEKAGTAWSAVSRAGFAPHPEPIPGRNCRLP